MFKIYHYVDYNFKHECWCQYSYVDLVRRKITSRHTMHGGYRHNMANNEKYRPPKYRFISVPSIRIKRVMIEGKARWDRDDWF